MTSTFENLCGPGKPLRVEPPDPKEFEGLRRLGMERLQDASIEGLSIASQFDLAYNAAHALAHAHALCLAALRWHGYRSSNRYIVFQLLPATLGLGPEVWRVLAKCHDQRNLGEYEGLLTVDERLLKDLTTSCHKVAEKLATLPPMRP